MSVQPKEEMQIILLSIDLCKTLSCHQTARKKVTDIFCDKYFVNLELLTLYLYISLAVVKYNEVDISASSSGRTKFLWSYSSW